jgi:hypothetical protein
MPDLAAAPQCLNIDINELLAPDRRAQTELSLRRSLTGTDLSKDVLISLSALENEKTQRD